jgi:hypothetical protein
MKKILLLYSLILSVFLVSCTGPLEEVQESTPLLFESLSYEIKSGDQKKVGDISYRVTRMQDMLSVSEVKFYNKEFLTGLHQDLKSEKNYVLSNDYVITGYSEKEYLDNKLRFTSEKTFKADEESLAIHSKNEEIMPDSKNNAAEFTIFYPIDQKVSEDAIIQLFYLSSFKNSPNKYLFYLNFQGESDFVHFIGEATIEHPLTGKKVSVYKFLTDSLSKTYVWVEQDTGLVLKKEEQLNEVTTLISTLKEVNPI